MSGFILYMINYVSEDSNESTVKERLLKTLYYMLIGLIVACACLIIYLYVFLGVFIIDFISYIFTGKAIIWSKLKGKIN